MEQISRCWEVMLRIENAFKDCRDAVARLVEGDEVRFGLDLGDCVAHGDPEACPAEHRDVIPVIADRDDSLGRDVFA